MTTAQEDLLEVCQELRAFVIKHGKHNQKTHGNRFGSGQAKESLRRLKDDKGAREKYKQQARKRGGAASGKNIKKMSRLEVQQEFHNATTNKRRAEAANELLKRGGFSDNKVATKKNQIPEITTDITGTRPTPQILSSRGKNALFRSGSNYDFGKVGKVEGKYYNGNFGNVKEVTPVFA